MLIEIVDYNESWPGEFARAAEPIREALAETALAIHHIGSTSVPGLAAKNIIDVQVTVAQLGEPVVDPMTAAGFTYRDDLPMDHSPPGASCNSGANAT